MLLSLCGVPSLPEHGVGCVTSSAMMVGPHQTSDKISHIDMADDRIDTIISHFISPYPVSISRMTISRW
jgi:hypothetical protein